jgi:transcriptional regulator with XRE-family HTH domain/molybdate-binding protein
MHSELRRRRIAAGLSQMALARAAGLSRQLVSAVESGRHAPGVAAAMALAAALGTTVEDLFGAAPQDHRAALGGDVPDGAPVVGARVGDVLSFAPLPERGAGATSWRRADGVISEGRVRLFPDASAAGFLVAGCDPAIGLAASLTAASGVPRIVAVHGSSGGSLAALRAGRLHAAVVHGPGDAVGPARPREQRLRVARWEVGLALGAGTRPDLDAIARGAVTVARRDPGAEAQRALDRALARHSDDPVVRGPLASGHIDAARRVAFGAVNAAVTMRPAAAIFALDFFPLEEHVVELVIDPRWSDHPGAARLADVLASRPFRERISLMDGYDLSVA